MGVYTTTANKWKQMIKNAHFIQRLMLYIYKIVVRNVVIWYIWRHWKHHFCRKNSRCVDDDNSAIRTRQWYVLERTWIELTSSGCAIEILQNKRKNIQASSQAIFIVLFCTWIFFRNSMFSIHKLNKLSVSRPLISIVDVMAIVIWWN